MHHISIKNIPIHNYDYLKNSVCFHTGERIVRKWQNTSEVKNCTVLLKKSYNTYGTKYSRMDQVKFVDNF